MTLLQRQIKATQATLEQVLQEYAEGKAHHWITNQCPLCVEFDPFYSKDCGDCPLAPVMCMIIKAEDFDGCPTLLEIAGFLTSLLLSLELLQKEKED